MPAKKRVRYEEPPSSLDLDDKLAFIQQQTLANKRQKRSKGFPQSEEEALADIATLYPALPPIEAKKLLKWATGAGLEILEDAAKAVGIVAGTGVVGGLGWTLGVASGNPVAAGVLLLGAGTVAVKGATKAENILSRVGSKLYTGLYKNAITRELGTDIAFKEFWDEHMYISRTTKLLNWRNTGRQGAQLNEGLTGLEYLPLGERYNPDSIVERLKRNWKRIRETPADAADRINMENLEKHINSPEFHESIGRGMNIAEINNAKNLAANSPSELTPGNVAYIEAVEQKYGKPIYLLEGKDVDPRLKAEKNPAAYIDEAWMARDKYKSPVIEEEGGVSGIEVSEHKTPPSGQVEDSGVGLGLNNSEHGGPPSEIVSGPVVEPGSVPVPTELEDVTKRLGLPPTATAEEITEAASKLGTWKNAFKETMEMPATLVRWMSQQEGVLGRVGNFMIRNGTRAGKVWRVAGPVLSVAASIWEGVNLVDLHEARKKIREYVEAHPEDELMSDYLKKKDAEVARHDAYFGVNTGLTVAGITTAVAGAAATAGVGGSVAAFLGSNPVGWALLGIGLIAYGTERIIEDEAKAKEYKEFLQKWYGSSDNPDLDFNLQKRNPDLEKYVQEIKKVKIDDSMSGPLKKYWQWLKSKVEKRYDPNYGYETENDPRYGDLLQIMQENPIPAIKSMEEDYRKEAADNGDFDMSVDFIRKEIKRKAAWESIGVNKDPMAYTSVEERNKKIELENQLEYSRSLKKEHYDNFKRNQYHQMLSDMGTHIDLITGKKHATGSEDLRTRPYVGDMNPGHTVAEHPRISADVPYDIPKDPFTGVIARKTQGGGIHEIQRNITTPYNSRMNDLYYGGNTHTGMAWTDFSQNNKNNDKLAAHGHEDAVRLYSVNAGQEKGIPQSKNPQADTAVINISSQTETDKPVPSLYTPYDPDHWMGGYDIQLHHNAPGAPAEDPTHMVTPGGSQDPFRSTSGSKAGISLGTLREYLSIQHTIPNQEPLVVAAHQNYMHDLAKRSALT